MQKPPLEFTNTVRPDVARQKLKYGITYGAVAGLAFAAVTWGSDAVLLAGAHALFPWMKLIIGLAACGLIGSFAGGLTSRLDRIWIAVPIWLAAALAYAWLVIALPFRIAPGVSAWLEPELRGLLHYVYYEEFATRFGIAYVWIAIFVSIIGLLQLPMSDSAVFSTSWFGKTAPMFLCVAIMGMSGIIVDGLNNEPLRSALIAVDQTVQFAVDHQGQALDPKLQQQMHLRSLRAVEPLIELPRRLIVQDFDRTLGELHILIRFGNVWVSCLSLYNQPTSCDSAAQ
ncbi:MAG TPA: hypothetical protein VGJ22_01260 [Anaerolineales bacterium]|jgi:hypothetical protein